MQHSEEHLLWVCKFCTAGTPWSLTSHISTVWYVHGVYSHTIFATSRLPFPSVISSHRLVCAILGKPPIYLSFVPPGAIEMRTPIASTNGLPETQQTKHYPRTRVSSCERQYIAHTVGSSMLRIRAGIGRLA